jgi:hypothetical protein
MKARRKKFLRNLILVVVESFSIVEVMTMWNRRVNAAFHVVNAMVPRPGIVRAYP